MLFLPYGYDVCKQVRIRKKAYYFYFTNCFAQAYNPYSDIVTVEGGGLNRGAGAGGGGQGAIKGAIAPTTFCLNGMDMPVPPLNFGKN